MPIDSMTKNLATSLVLYEKVDTTAARAKHIRAYLEHLLSIARRGDLASRRRLIKSFTHQNATKKVFDLIVPNLQNYHRSGFIFSHRIAGRVRDNAGMIRLVIDPMLTEPIVTEKPSKEIVKQDMNAKKNTRHMAKEQAAHKKIDSTSKKSDKK